MKLAFPTILIAAAVLAPADAKLERRRKHNRVLQEETATAEAADSALPEEDPEDVWIYVPPLPPFYSPPRPPHDGGVIPCPVGAPGCDPCFAGAPGCPPEPPCPSGAPGCDPCPQGAPGCGPPPPVPCPAGAPGCDPCPSGSPGCGPDVGKPYYPPPPAPKPYYPPPQPPKYGPCCSWNWATCGTYHPYCNANPYQCEDGCDGYWIDTVVKPPKYGAQPTCIPLWGQCEPPHLHLGGGYPKPLPPPCCGPEPPCMITGTKVPCVAGTIGCGCDQAPGGDGGGGYGGHGGGYGAPCVAGDMGCDPCPDGDYGCKPYRPPPPHPSDQYPVCHDDGGGYAQCVPAHQIPGYYGGGGYGIGEDEVAAFLMNSMSFSMASTEEVDGGEIEFGKRN